MFCTNCGQNLAENGGNFCAGCGKRISVNVVNEARSDPPIPQRPSLKPSPKKQRLPVILAAFVVILASIGAFMLIWGPLSGGGMPSDASATQTSNQSQRADETTTVDDIPHRLSIPYIYQLITQELGKLHSAYGRHGKGIANQANAIYRLRETIIEHNLENYESGEDWRPSAKAIARQGLLEELWLLAPEQDETQSNEEYTYSQEASQDTTPQTLTLNNGLEVQLPNNQEIRDLFVQDFELRQSLNSAYFLFDNESTQHWAESIFHTYHNYGHYMAIMILSTTISDMKSLQAENEWAPPAETGQHEMTTIRTHGFDFTIPNNDDVIMAFTTLADAILYFESLPWLPHLQDSSLQERYNFLHDLASELPQLSTEDAFEMIWTFVNMHVDYHHFPDGTH